MEIGEVVAGMMGGKGCRLAEEAIRRLGGRETGRRGDGVAGQSAVHRKKRSSLATTSNTFSEPFLAGSKKLKHI
jgi:hypothetical protein